MMTAWACPGTPVKRSSGIAWQLNRGMPMPKILSDISMERANGYLKITKRHRSGIEKLQTRDTFRLNSTLDLFVPRAGAFPGIVSRP